MKKSLPYLLFAIGILLIVSAGFLAWGTSNLNSSSDLPPSVAGLELSKNLDGQAALASISQLHGLDLSLASGVVAEYGQSEARLWLTEVESEAAAIDLIKKMENKIAAGNSPYTPMGVYKFQNRDVYLLSGMGQTHFYAQSGRKIFWLSIAPEKAEQALKDLLSFYK